MVVPHIACLSVRRQAIGRVRCRRKTAADRLRLQLYCLGAEESTAIASGRRNIHMLFSLLCSI